MELPHKPQANGKLLQPLQTEIECSHVVEDLSHLRPLIALCFDLACLRGENLTQARLRTLDCQRRDGFPAPVCRTDEVWVR